MIFFETMAIEVDKWDGDSRRWPLVEVTMWEDNDLGERKLVAARVIDVEAAPHLRDRLGIAGGGDNDGRPMLTVEGGNARWLGRHPIALSMVPSDPRQG